MLTIVIITMNRKKKLIEALESCMLCTLPPRTKFLIFDNASTDCTFERVNEYIENHKNSSIEYYRSDTNLGVGGGRSKAFSMTSTKYVYFMDDDALIMKEYQGCFFVHSIDYLEKNPQVASLSTDIEDRYLGKTRTQGVYHNSISGCSCVPMFLGGSHFLRKSAFSEPLYLNIQYGLEELYPSILAMDNNYLHVLDKKISIYHNPEKNKWVDNSDAKRQIAKSYCINGYSTKALLYPKLFIPVLKLANLLRVKKHLNGSYKEIKHEITQFLNYHKGISRIKISTVFKMLRLFGPAIF